MSVVRGRPEVTGECRTDAIDPKRNSEKKVMRIYTVGFPIAIMLTDRDRSVCTTHLIRE
jgi:hypothetical protein